MGRKACISLIILALVLLSGPGTRAATGYSKDEALMPSSSSMKLEDGVAQELGVMTLVELEVHSVLLGGNSVSPATLGHDKPVCVAHPCVAGGPYSGGSRGCSAHYQCRGGGPGYVRASV
uniref:Uncharacterized protein n=1 Tax=Hordeum vulgare subsp. vulgare TaxID=112509 RepID=A0A8I6XU94_HORVV